VIADDFDAIRNALNSINQNKRINEMAIRTIKLGVPLSAKIPEPKPLFDDVGSPYRGLSGKSQGGCFEGSETGQRD